MQACSQWSRSAYNVIAKKCVNLSDCINLVIMASISNNEIKRVKSLQQKKFRDETGLFIVEGEKMVEEACASGFSIENVYRRDEIGQAAMS